MSLLLWHNYKSYQKQNLWLNQYPNGNSDAFRASCFMTLLIGPLLCVSVCCLWSMWIADPQLLWPIKMAIPRGSAYYKVGFRDRNLICLIHSDILRVALCWVLFSRDIFQLYYWQICEILRCWSSPLTVSCPGGLFMAGDKGCPFIGKQATLGVFYCLPWSFYLLASVCTPTFFVSSA